MSGIYLQSVYFNQEVSKISNVGYKIVPCGYITYRSMTDTNVFRFNVQNIIEIGIVSPAYPVFNGIFNIVDNNFLTYEMNSSNTFLSQLLWTKEGGTRFALSYTKLSELLVNLPSIKEQKKITGILKKLDDLITLHQRKLVLSLI